MKKLGLIACICLVLELASATTWAEPITLTFNELPTQPVNGLSFSGVTFGFTVGGLASTDARYNAAGPGTLTFVQGQVLEGDAAGILTLNFAVPTPVLSFGVALTSLSALTPGLTVQLFDPMLQPLGVFSVNTSPLVSFSEGLFNHSGALVGRAVIDFNENFTAPPPGFRRFALDNLTFEPIPEPTTLVLLGTGLAGVSAVCRRRRRDHKSEAE